MSIAGTKKTEEKIAEAEKELEEIKAVEGLPEVKQLIRWISKTNITSPDMEYDRVQDIDLELSGLYKNGYTLFATHYLGQNPEAFGVLYILTK